MAASPSDSVSLADIMAELERVQARKEELLHAAKALENEELRLHSAAHALRDFLEYRRAKGGSTSSVPDLILRQPNGTVVLAQIKAPHDHGEPHEGARQGGVREIRSILGWAAGVLREQGNREPIDTWPLIHRMQELGFTSSAEKIYLSVYGTLNRAAKRPDCPVVKVGSRWGLREWYPDGVPVVTEETPAEEEEQAMLIPDAAS